MAKVITNSRFGMFFSVKSELEKNELPDSVQFTIDRVEDENENSVVQVDVDIDGNAFGTFIVKDDYMDTDDVVVVWCPEQIDSPISPSKHFPEGEYGLAVTWITSSVQTAIFPRVKA